MPVVIAGMDSEPWAARLRVPLRALVTHNASPGPDNGDLAFELLIGAYCARRLLEIGAEEGPVSDRRWGDGFYGRDSNVALPSGDFVVAGNILDAYDFTLCDTRTNSSWTLLNFLMHSSLVLPMTEGEEGEPGSMVGLLFTSDRLRDKGLISIPLSTLERLLALISDHTKHVQDEADRVVKRLLGDLAGQ